jgi:mRNA interferase MazF
MMRGELWWVDLGIPFGSEPGYRRPVLIIQNDYFNNSKINTTIVVPLTTNILYVDAPGNIFLNRNETRLNIDSVLITSQVRVIDRKRLVERISKLSKVIIEEVERNILLVLGVIKL